MSLTIADTRMKKNTENLKNDVMSKTNVCIHSQILYLRLP